MSYYLKLHVPESDQTEDTIRRYYGYHILKSRHLDCRPLAGFRLTLEEFNERDKFIVSELLYDEYVDMIGEETLKRLCEPNDIWNCRLAGPDLSRLILEIRQAVEELSERNGPNDKKWTLSTEPQSIALCEFAYCNGYEIEMYPD